MSSKAVIRRTPAGSSGKDESSTSSKPSKPSKPSKGPPPPKPMKSSTIVKTAAPTRPTVPLTSTYMNARHWRMRPYRIEGVTYLVGMSTSGIYIQASPAGWLYRARGGQPMQFVYWDSDDHPTWILERGYKAVYYVERGRWVIHGPDANPPRLPKVGEQGGMTVSVLDTGAVIAGPRIEEL